MRNKEKLISALREEGSTLRLLGYDVSDHEYAILFLETGIINVNKKNIINYNILYAVINDYDSLLNDYGCN